MDDYGRGEGFPIDYTKSPASIGRQIQRNNELAVRETEVVDAVPVQEDIFYGLKRDLVNFFSNRMEEIKSKDAIQKRIIEKFSDMLEMDDLSFEQLMAIYKTVSNDSRYSTDSLLAIFKPVPGVESPFSSATMKQNESRDAFDQVYEQMSSEDLENIDTLLKLLRVASKNQEKEI